MDRGQPSSFFPFPARASSSSARGALGLLPRAAARYTSGMDTFGQMFEQFKVQGRDLAEKVRELVHEGNVRRIIIKDEAGHTYMEIPLTVATVGIVLAPVHLQTVCVRHQPPGLSDDALDQHTLAWAATINQSGQAYVTPALLDGRWMVRVSIGAELTERQHVSQLWELMQHHVE